MTNLMPVPDPPAPAPPARPIAVPIDRAGLTLPRIRIVPADGEPYEVQAYNPDLLLYEETAAKHRWPGPTAAPFGWLTFLGWAASRRTGAIPADLTWESFKASTLEISDGGQTPVPPTAPGPAPG